MVTVLVLTLLQTFLPVTTDFGLPTSQAAQLFENRGNFQQWTTWQGVAANHVPYKTSVGTAEITSNSDAINLTQDAGSQSGFLWNSQTYSYAQDLSVSANIYLGAKDGADGLMFSMRPLDQWPNDGISGSTGGGTGFWATGEIRAFLDTYQNEGERAEDHLRVQAVTLSNVETKYTGTGVLLKNGSGTEISDVENNQFYPFTFRWTASSRTFAVYSGLSANHLIYSTVITNAELDATQFAWGWAGFTGGASNFQAISDVSYHVGPTVTSTDTDRTVGDGTSVTLSASFTSSETSPTKRWEYSTSGGSSWTSTGITDSTYTFTATRALTQRQYRFYVESTAMGITYTKATTPVTLTVLPPSLLSETDTAINTSPNRFLYANSAKSIFPSEISTMTMEAWVNPSTECDGNYYCSILASNYSFILDVYQGKIAYIIGSGSAWCTNGAVVTVPKGIVPSGSWSHVAMVRNSANVKIYINGSLVSDANSSCVPTSLTATSSQQFRIGSRDLHDQHFYGSIDEVRIWNTDRSASISSDMHSNETSTSGLTNYWNFNEGTGGIAYNQVPGASSESDLISYGSDKDSPSFWNADSISFASTSGPYSIRTFKRSYITAGGGWKVPTRAESATALIVAGGGGGGSRIGGGGGGGGYALLNRIALSQGTFSSITVGMGGFGARAFSDPNDYAQGQNGQDSKIGSQYIAIGGGGGGGYLSSVAGQFNGRSGGSGGGASAGATAYSSGLAGSSIQNSSYGYGLGNSGGLGYGATAGYYPAGGGGGAGGAGGSATGSNDKGVGGAGLIDPIGGTSTCFSAGGGGGVGNYNTQPVVSGTADLQNSAGTCGGGTTTASAGTKGMTVPKSATPNSGSGGGGAGYVTGNNSNVAGGNGGSGIVIIRWIIASAPIFTAPAEVDTTTAGLKYNFQMSGSAISPLTRNYKWEFSSDTGTTWSTLQSSTVDSYTTTTLETTTSGIRYKYRVTVTDSDTAGLFISESATVYLVINPRITITGSLVSLTQKYGETQTVTYTIANGTGTRTTTASPNNRSGITWSAVSGSSATLSIGAGLGFGTYYETLTVTDSVTATTTQMVTIAISKADTITVTVNNPSALNYTGSTASFTPSVSFSGLKNSDAATASSVTITQTRAGNTCAMGGTCAIGDRGPGGGIVFITPSTVSGNGKYFEAAPDAWYGANDLSTVGKFCTSASSRDNTNEGATQYGIGWGETNTAIFRVNCTGGAVKLATDYRGGGMSDWFVPNKNELAEMAKIPSTVDLINVTNYWGYWSSTEDGSGPASTMSSLTSSSWTIGAVSKSDSTHNMVRPVRMFTPCNAVDSCTAFASTTMPTNAGTYRLTPSALSLDSGSLSNYQGVTYSPGLLTINKVNQTPISIGQYDAFPGISTYPLNVYGGTGTGVMRRTLTSAGSANCSLTNMIFITASNTGTCTVSVTKAADFNYNLEVATSTIYWIQFVDRYTNSGPTTPTDLGLSGATAVERRSYEAFSVLSFANGSGTAVTSAAKGSVMRIIGTGFDPNDETTEVIIGFLSIPKSSLTFDISNPAANFVQFVLPNSSELDLGANEVGMYSSKGWAYASGLLTVTAPASI